MNLHLDSMIKSGKVIEKKCVVCKKPFFTYSENKSYRRLKHGMRKVTNVTCSPLCARERSSH